MPLPLAYNCTDCDTVCCDVLFTLADRLRIDAAAAVNACLPVEECGEIDSFVALGFESEDPIGDSLSVVIANIQDAGDSTVNEQTGMLTMIRADLVLQLLETGYPMLETEGTNILVPDRDLVHQAARHSISHMESILRAVRNGLRRPSYPMWKPYVPAGSIFGVVPQPVRPLRPSGGLAGWSMTIGVRVGLGNQP